VTRESRNSKKELKIGIIDGLELPPLRINKSRSGGLNSPLNFPSSMSSKNLRDRGIFRGFIIFIMMKLQEMK
jgi:hypothetical protein